MDNIVTLLSVGIALIIGFYIFRFMIKMVAFLLVISIALGTISYDYYFNYQEGNETFIIKYVQDYLPMEEIDIHMEEIRETSIQKLNDLKEAPSDMLYKSPSN